MKKLIIIALFIASFNAKAYTKDYCNQLVFAGIVAGETESFCVVQKNGMPESIAFQFNASNCPNLLSENERHDIANKATLFFYKETRDKGNAAACRELVSVYSK